MPDVFISYSRKDADFVRRLHAALAKSNHDVWVDWEDIPLTADWWQEIGRGIESADTFLLVVTPNSLSSPICTLEITHAIQHNKRLVPIVHSDFDEKAAFAQLAAHVPDDSLRKTLAGRDLLTLAGENWQQVARHNWLLFKDDAEFDSNFQKLITAVDTDLDYVRRHTRFLIQAREWEAHERDESYLLAGAEIREAEAFLAKSVNTLPHPTDLHAEYIVASQKAETKRQQYEQRLQKLARDRLRLLIAFLVIGVTALFISFAWFYSFVRNANFNSAKESLETILKLTASYIDGDEFAQLIIDAPPTVNGYPQDQRFWEQVQQLHQVHEIDPGLYPYTYTGNSNRNEIYYVADSRALENPPSGATFLETDAESAAPMWQGFQETTIQVDSYSDESGSWVSGFTPIKTSRGATVGALGIDLRIDDYLAVPQQVMQIALIILVVLVIGGIIAAGVFIVLRVRQRRETAEN